MKCIIENIDSIISSSLCFSIKKFFKTNFAQQQYKTL